MFAEAQFQDILAPYRVPGVMEYPVTVCGRTSKWTVVGREYLKQADPFCACTRLIVDRKIRGVPYSKAELSARFGLSSRLFNSAEVFAKGEHESIEKTKVLALNRAKAKYIKAIDEYMKGFLSGMTGAHEKNIIARIGKWRRRVEREEANQAKPRYFPGHKVFEKQHLLGKERFKKLYREARNNRIGSVGTWEEAPCCNSELQIQFEGYVKQGMVTTGYNFKLIHSRDVLCSFKLARNDGSQLLERITQNQVPYEYGSELRIPTKKELKSGKFGYDENFIGPMAIPYEKKIRKDYYIPLTVVLLRDPKKINRWQIRVSWIQPGVKPYEVGNMFLSYDINNDSLAYTLLRIENGQVTVLYKHEPKFEARATNGKDRERRLHFALNAMFKLAKKHHACIVGEDLRFEGTKVGFSTVNSMLHDIPYATIRDAIIRKGLKQGIPVRFISPAFTSLLGGLFTEHNRDKAAALVIGLNGSQQGIDLLETMCKKHMTESLKDGGISYKVEVKNRFSEVVKVVSCHQHEGGDRQGGSTFTYILSRILSDVTRHRKAVHYRNRKARKRLPSVVFLEDIRNAAMPGPNIVGTEASTISCFPA
jgi:IS605 OrfB family transposase